jgi:hypothetical protein
LQSVLSDSAQDVLPPPGIGGELVEDLPLILVRQPVAQMIDYSVVHRVSADEEQRLVDGS